MTICMPLMNSTISAGLLQTAISLITKSVYMCLYRTLQKKYNYESTDEQIIINAASLRSIHTTWKDEEKVRTGKQRLAAIMYAKESGEQQKDFTLIIDDSAVYHTLNDFRSAEARKLYQQRIHKAEGL